MYFINPNITMIKCGEYSEDGDLPYIMIREGSAVSALNATAGIVLEKLGSRPKEVESLIEEIKSEFEEKENMEEDIKNIIN